MVFIATKHGNEAGIIYRYSTNFANQTWETLKTILSK